MQRSHATLYYSNVVENVKKQRKVISALKENCQFLKLFVEEYSEKHKSFKYPLATFLFAI